MEERLLESRGIAYRLSTYHPARPTLLFVHGLSGSASAWAEYEHAFEQEYNIIAVDLRGHGHSCRPTKKKDYALTLFAEDIKAVLDHERIGKVYMISHSFGTLVAREFINSNPERVVGAVFLAPLYRLHRLWGARVLQYLAGVITPLVATKEIYGARVNYDNFRNTAEWSLRRIVTDIYNTGLRPYLWSLQHSYSAVDKRWQGLRVPTLFIHGSADHFVPVGHTRALVHHISHARFIELPGANHILVLNNAAEIIEQIRTFVEQTKQ